MNSRVGLLFTVLTLCSAMLSSSGEAQESRRKKPFAAFSESAERLKDSVSARFRPALPSNSPTPSVAATASGPGIDLGTTAMIDPAVFELALRDSIVAAARAQIGTRYVWGGTTPKGFDCSGLVKYVLASLKLDLPRTAHQQSSMGSTVARDANQLRPGDLLTFGKGKRITHIGIYVGDGRFVHASTKARRVIESRLDRTTSPLIKTWREARSVLALLETSDSDL